MSIKLSHIVGSLGLVAAGVLSNVAPASASLIGGVSINPIPSLTAGVILEGTGLCGNPLAPLAPAQPCGTPGFINPITNIDAAPPTFQNNPAAGNGLIIEVGVDDPSSDFVPFIGWLGTVDDLSVGPGFCAVCQIQPGLGGTNASLVPQVGGTVFDYITVNNPNGNPNPNDGIGGFTFDLQFLSIGNYTEIPSGGGTSTTVSLSATGLFYKLAEDGVTRTADAPSLGQLNLSADFPGLTADQVRALFDAPGEIPTVGGNPITWNYSIAAVASKDVPEPSTTISLISVALGGAALTFRKRMQK